MISGETYRLLAAVLAAESSGATPAQRKILRNVAASLAVMFRADNSRFSQARFVAATEVTDEPETAALIAHPSGRGCLALAALRECRDAMHCAKVSALTAGELLAGARAARAVELAVRLDDSIGWCERLSFIVTGDQRADNAG